MKISKVLSVLALVVAIAALGTTLFIYFSGTKPQTAFQRIDVELQRVKERLDEITRQTERLRNQEVDVTSLDESLREAWAVYYQAWDAWLQHDFPRAEELLRDSVKLLPPPPPPGPITSQWWFWVVIVVGVLLIVYLFWRLRG